MHRQPKSQLLRLEIDPVISNAEQIARRVRTELPGHAGIARASSGVAAAAHEAKRVAAKLRRPLGYHRLPAMFLALALLVLGIWIYWDFFHVATLTIALPERDAVALHRRLSGSRRVRFEMRLTEGSRENAALLEAGKVDLGFVQGGIPIADDLPRLETGKPELLLFFVREGISDPRQVRRVLTSLENQGSHSVALDFFRLWQIAEQVTFVHDWNGLAGEADYQLADDIDAVFVIKDPANEKTFRAAQRLADAGFHLATPDLGARSTALPYLRPTEISRAYLAWAPPLPAQTVQTYTVATYLVARRGLTPRRMAAAAHLLDPDTTAFLERSYEPTMSDAGEILQGVEAFLGILVYIGLAFLALLGWEITTYRRRFHELNTLISLITVHQSDKDVLGLTDEGQLRENLLYLSICSDLLGLIAVITGYYAQENSSLLYSNLLEIIHHRCNGLKLNIQTKILHASIVLPDGSSMPDSSARRGRQRHDPSDLDQPPEAEDGQA